jgi:Ca-activated chloride channel homolog
MKKTIFLLAGSVGVLLAAVILEQVMARPAVAAKPAICSGWCQHDQRAALHFGEVRTRLSGARVLHNADGEMHVMVELSAKPCDLAVRPPLSLALVLDRSGSMGSDNKLVTAKEAARGLVDGLFEHDRVAVVQYNASAEVILPLTAMDAAGKQQALAAINSVLAEGGTNLYEGWMLGQREVLRSRGTGGVVNRVVLLTDGQANVGETSPAVLTRAAASAAEMGVRLTSVGLGLDYNENLLEALADHGRGSYYYARDAGGLLRVFAGELRAMQGTVATNAEILLTPASPEVQIAEVYDHVTRKEGNTVAVPLADIAGHDRRWVVARLRVPVERLGRRDLLSVGFAANEPAKDAREAKTFTLGVEVSRNPALVEQSLDREVMSKVLQLDGVRVMRQAIAAHAGGDVAGAIALTRDWQRQAERKTARFSLPGGDSIRDLFAASTNALAGETRVDSPTARHTRKRTLYSLKSVSAVSMEQKP